jgi:hypothetical protein
MPNSKKDYKSNTKLGFIKTKKDGKAKSKEGELYQSNTI